VLDRAALRLRTDEVGIAGAVGLAERVTTGDEGDRLLVVHRHPGERDPDVVGRGERVRTAFGALRVDVDQAHGHVAEGRVGQIERILAGVALVAEPGVLRAPEDLLWFPDVLAAEAEAERGEPHRLERDVAGEHEQIGPGDLLAVLLLDRPQQAAGLVEVGVVRPAVQRGEALAPVTTTATPVLDAIGAGLVPRHADEQWSVVAVVGRPPVLRGGHHLDDVGLERLDVQAGERRPVVEVGAERVASRRMLVEDGQVQLVRPPVLVAAGPVR
jgi:hypothetical protein